MYGKMPKCTKLIKWYRLYTVSHPVEASVMSTALNGPVVRLSCALIQKIIDGHRQFLSLNQLIIQGRTLIVLFTTSRRRVMKQNERYL